MIGSGPQNGHQIMWTNNRGPVTIVSSSWMWMRSRSSWLAGRHSSRAAYSSSPDDVSSI